MTIGDFVQVYLDDIVVFSKSERVHYDYFFFFFLNRQIQEKNRFCITSPLAGIIYWFNIQLIIY